MLEFHHLKVRTPQEFCNLKLGDSIVPAVSRNQGQNCHRFIAYVEDFPEFSEIFLMLFHRVIPETIIFYVIVHAVQLGKKSGQFDFVAEVFFLFCHILFF